ncbi:MAG TPA: acyltransferase [Opitutaceae bacterium]|nr:acyltransferase [Opitutaceae bacterium]
MSQAIAEGAAAEKKPVAHSPGHIDALDGIRGLAILLVLAHHFFGYDVRHIWWLDLVFKFVGYGWCGVDLFFVLSGFLITGILLKTKTSAHYFRNFYMRRTLRIFPLYYGCLLVALILLPALGWNVGRQPGTAGQSWYWLYGTNLLISLQGSWETTGSAFFRVGHFWSLAVEEHFYLVWPFVVYFVPTKKLWTVCVTIAVSVFCLRSAWFLWTRDWITADVWTPCRADSLVMGGLAALALNSPMPREVLKRYSARVFGIVGTGLVAALVAQVDRETSLFVSTFGYTALAVFFAALILYVVLSGPGHWASGFFSGPTLRFFGRYSYGIYVYHMFVLSGFVVFSADKFFAQIVHSSLGGMVVSRLAALLVTLIAAIISWHLYEKQFLRLKRFFA